MDPLLSENFLSKVRTSLALIDAVLVGGTGGRFSSRSDEVSEVLDPLLSLTLPLPTLFLVRVLLFPLSLLADCLLDKVPAVLLPLLLLEIVRFRDRSEGVRDAGLADPGVGGADLVLSGVITIPPVLLFFFFCF